MADYDRALQIDPNDEHAYNNRGLALQSQGDLEAAVMDFDLAIRINPQFSAAQYNRAWAKYAQGDILGALFDLF